MNNEAFTALLVEATANNQFQQRIVQKSVSDLPDHPLLVDVRYSSLNYKDALSANGKPGVTKQYPHTPGIDAAGTVLSDTSGTYKVGDQVIVSGYDLGMNTSGGFAQRIRVPVEWAVPLPPSMTLKDAMTIGTAGFTAALCIRKLQQMGAAPSQGPVLVTGATGGVGSFSVALLNHLGYAVTAATGKTEHSEWLAGLGAHKIIDRNVLSEPSSRPIGQMQWANAVDCVGGDILSNILKGLHYQGSVAICGMTQSPNFQASVFPFILRGVNLLGVDCVELALEEKKENWRILASEMKLPKLEAMAQTISLAQVPEYLTRILNGHGIGRYLVDLQA